ncbi:MAG: Npt1/Npt2 family nucleotide transporter [Calditrichia bacterium]
MNSESTGRKNPLEKFLSIFTEVKAGEGLTALLLFFNLFILLMAYYVVKTVREALILAGSGAEVKSYSAAGQALLLLVAVPLYSRLAGRFNRRKLINVVTLFFIVCLLFFYLLAYLEFPLGVIFYLWVGIFSLMVVAQFWAFANDLYTPEAGKRIFVIIAFGASAGAVVGSFAAGRLIEPFGIYQLMLISALLLVVNLLITNWVDAREKMRMVKPDVPALDTAEAPIGKGDAFRLVFSSRYLLLIAFLLLFLNWVNTTGEYILGRTVERAALDYVNMGVEPSLTVAQYIGKFYSDFFTVVNLVGLLMQLFLVSRILKYLGVRAAILFLPVIALGGYIIMAFYPLLGAIRWAKTAENATDYSLQNTVRQVLFLPTTREEKYKAKQAIDTFFVRAGDVLSAGLVYLGVQVFAFQTRQFALLNLFLVGVWIILSILIGLEYRRRTRQQNNADFTTDISDSGA